MHKVINKLVILRRKQVEIKTGLSRSTIYQKLEKGIFPKPISLGDRAVGWIESEVEEWLAMRVAKRDQGLEGRNE